MRLGVVVGALLVAFIGLAAAKPAFAQTNDYAELCKQAYEGVVKNPSAANIDAFLRQFGDCEQAAKVRDLRTGPDPQNQPTRGAAGGGDRGPLPENPSYVAVGRFAGQNTRLIAEGGGYGLVILRRGNDLNDWACEQFSQALPFTSEAVTGRAQLGPDGLVYRRPIYWPLATQTLPDHQPNCRTMVSSYDFERALALTSRLDNRLKGAGPFIVLVRADGRRAGVFDFSGMPRDEFKRQFTAVVLKLSQADNIWDEAFYTRASMRQRLRRAIVDESEITNFVVASILNLPAAAGVLLAR